MPRRSAAEKVATHDSIVRHASRAFRSHGSTVGIADVMKDLGLTQGGFYRHFSSKEDLFVEAVAHSFEEMGDKLEAVAKVAPPAKQVRAIINAYLSKEHLEHPETWCALATLAPEIARMPETVRKRVNAASHAYMQRMAKYMPGRSEREKSKNFILLFSAMAGVIALSRSLGERTMQEAALKMGRDHQLQIFAPAVSRVQSR